MELQAGSIVGPYQVEGLLAPGGMSMVYLVRHQEQDTRHALKVLTIHTQSVRERLEQEGRLQRLLQHPNIVPVSEVIRVMHAPALVMEYVAGPDLAALMQRCTLSVDQVDQLAQGTMRGMSVAHANGMVHRDLKPSNILIEIQPDSLTARVTDFGLAKMWSTPSDRPLTHSGVVMGTPGYVAPEQIWDASSVDARADIFSLGTILYEALSGKRAFDAGHNIEIWSAITAGRYTPLDQHRTDLPKALVRTIHRAMSVDRDQRFPDMRTFQDQWTHALEAIHRPEASSWIGPTLDTAQQLLAERHNRIADATHETGLDDDITTTMYAYQLDSKHSQTEESSPARTGLEITASSPTQRPTSNRTLPVQVDRFFGRTDELATLHQNLTGTSRIVTLTGPGGMGKTRLSLVYAEQNEDAFPGGIWFCDLSEAHTTQDILRAIAQALHVPLSDRKASEQIAHAIDGRGQTLLILDNMEQVVAHARETVGLWAQVATQARFLVTSRIQLGLQGEQIQVLDSLDRAAAIQLFEDRARQLQPQLQLSEEDMDVVGRLVDRLDGISLPIELAAARTQMLSPAQILQRLEARFQLLTSAHTPNTDRPTRHATLKGAIDWSWDLLTPVEQATLAQCSIFRGGFSLSAAEEIIDLDAWEDWPMDVVQRLVNQSLIRSAEPFAGHRRFQMYESIRIYAQDKMRTHEAVVDNKGVPHTGPDALHALSVRHCTHFASMGEEDTLATAFWQADHVHRQAFCLEQDNLSAANAFGQTLPNPAIPALCTVALAAIHRWFGPYAPALEQVTTTLLRDDLGPRTRLQLTEAASTLHANLGQVSKAFEANEASIELAVLLQDVGAQGRAISKRVSFLQAQWSLNATEAVSGYEEALEMHRSVGDWRAEIDTLLSIANTALGLSQMQQARPFLETALKKARKHGCGRREARALRQRALYYMDTGQMDLAERDLKDALTQAEKTLELNFFIQVHTSLGTLYKEQGQLQASQKIHEAGIQLSRLNGCIGPECVLMGNLALILQLQGKIDQARALYEETIELADDWDIEREIGLMARGNLGDLTLNQGDLPASAMHLEAAIAGLDQRDNNAAGAFRGSLAVVRAQMGDVQAARDLLDHGERQLRDVWVIEWGRLLCRRAQVEFIAQCPSAADEALDQAKHIASQLGGSADSDLGQLITLTQVILHGSNATKTTAETGAQPTEVREGDCTE